MPSFCFLPLLRRSAAGERTIYLRTGGHLYCFGRKL